jgi:hypothetical protein
MEEIDIGDCDLMSTKVTGPRQRISVTLSEDDVAYSSNKRIKTEDGSSALASGLSEDSIETAKVSLIHLLPVPRSVKTGQFLSKVTKDRSVSFVNGLFYFYLKVLF